MALFIARISRWGDCLLLPSLTTTRLATSASGGWASNLTFRRGPQAALLGYDEGLQDDRVLASALWRRLFARAGRDATRLETIVAYVRRELARLDRLSRDRLLLYGKNQWGPLQVT